ncbi:MAG: ABC transporter permease, partial [Chitinophagaceae bacterium]|nr:ABC transporter permease [Chitinophagaceae bacterium]
MFKNYFKIAYRNLKRNKIFSFINIAGLALGLASAMLIILYVKDEVSFDRFHSNVSHIYRIVNKSHFLGEDRTNVNSGILQGPKFKANVPGIESFVRIQSGNEDFKKGTEVVSRDLLFVDSNFFSMFTFPLYSGDPVSCLKSPHSIVISEDEAMKQFGTRDAIGKMVMIKEDTTFVPYQVTAISKKCPQNSSIQFDILLPFRENPEAAASNDNWFSFFLSTFVTVSPNANIATINKQMQAFYVKDATETFKKLMKMFGGNPDETLNEYFLQPYT